MWYSADFVKWAVGIHSDDDIREMSFYYEDYRWMNEYLDGEHDRVLLFPMSGVSYYLDVPYLRGTLWPPSSIGSGLPRVIREPYWK